MPKKFNPEIADIARKLIGETFRNRREELGITQIQLSECSGITQRNISAFEAGNQNITINSLLALGGCLRMEIQFHMKDPDTVPGFPKSSSN